MVHYTTNVTPVEEGVYHRKLDEAGTMPLAMFLPQAYEPRYPYPLLVFLHERGERETERLQSIPSLSRRNYICIGLRGPRPVTFEDQTEGFGWGRRLDAMIEDYIFTAIRETMRCCHVHSERIFLVGCGEGAGIAYQMGLSFSDKIAGVVALNGKLPPYPVQLPPLGKPDRVELFVGHGRENNVTPIHKVQQACKLFYSAGLNLDTKVYDHDHTVSDEMLRDVDRWIMDHCNRERY